MPIEVPDAAERKRRIPQQSRSRERVERLLEAAAGLVTEVGVEQLSTRAIAERAQVPVASLYQYFADKDEILVALIQQELNGLDARVARSLAALTDPSIRDIADALVDAMAETYQSSAAFVTIWLRGRGNPTVRHLGRAQNERLTHALVDKCRAEGLLSVESDPLFADVAVEVADRCLQLAFDRSDDGDADVIAETKDLVATYLERRTAPVH